MFATLLGSLPRPPLPADAEPEAVLAAILRAQEAAGLEPLIDAGFGIGETVADRWRTTASLTDRPVKQVLLGPCSRGAEVTDRDVVAIRADIVALAAAGCPMIEIHEPAVTGIGTHEAARARFRDAHCRLLDGVTSTHLSLAITGGNADAAGIDTILAAPYASLALDLISGPDNWRIVVATPGDRGIVAGALSVSETSDDRPEVLLWAAGYAASTAGRGRGRVGLASAASLAHLPWDVALKKLRVLGEAARLADLPPADRRLQLDPRAVDMRSAALGRYDARPRLAARRPAPRRPSDQT